MDSDGGGSSDHAEPPRMTITTETVSITQDDGYHCYTTTELGDRATSPLKSSTASLRSYCSTRSSRARSTASSVDSKTSTDTLTLNSDENVSKSRGSSVASQDHRRNIIQEPAESDRLKQFLYSTTNGNKSSSSSVHSNESRNDTEAKRVENEHPSKHLRSGARASRSSVSSASSDGGSVADIVQRNLESDRLREFMEGFDSKSETSSIRSQMSPGKAPPRRTTSRNSVAKRAPSRQNSSSCCSSQNSVDSTENLKLERAESDRLKKFLTGEDNSQTEVKTTVENNVRSGSNHKLYSASVQSDDALSTASSDSMDRTLVPAAANHTGESERLRAFLGHMDVPKSPAIDSVSSCSRSASSSPTKVKYNKSKESKRLRAFLNDGDNLSSASSTRDTSPDIHNHRYSGDKSMSNNSPINSHTGLSQVMDDVTITSAQKAPSPLKRRLVEDKFSFDSDSESNNQSIEKLSSVAMNDSSVTPAASETTTTVSGELNSSSKPKINFEKMEGRKAKTSSKPVKKLLPGKVSSSFYCSQVEVITALT